MKSAKTLAFCLLLALHFFSLKKAAGQPRDSCEAWILRADNLYNEKKYAEFMGLINQLGEQCKVEARRDTFAAKYWNGLGGAYVMMGNMKGALQQFEKVTALLDSLHLAESLDYMSALLSSAAVLYYQADYENAERYAERAYPLAMKLKPPGHFIRGHALNFKGQFLFLHEKYADCISVLEEALKNREGASELEYDFFRLETLNSLAVAYWRLGQYQKADAAFEEILQLTTRLKHPQSYVFLFNVGAYYRERGKLEKAFELLSQSVRRAEKNKKQDPVFYGVALNNLAVLHRDWGQYARAVELTEEARQYLSESAPENRFYRATMLNNLGFLYSELCQFDKAIPHQEAALREFENAGYLPPTYTSWLTNLAVSYQMVGQLDKARPLLAQAIALVQSDSAIFSKFEIAAVRMAEANIYLQGGKIDTAVVLYQNQLKVLKELQGEQGFQYRQLMLALGIAHLEKGELAQAEQLFQNLLSNFESMDSKDPSTKSWLFVSIGNLYAAKKDFQQAKSYYLKSLTGIESYAGKKNLKYSQALNFLGKTEASLGNLGAAFSYFEEADAILHNQLIRNFEIFNERDKTALLQLIRGGFESYAEFALNHPELPRVKTMIFEDDMALRGLLLFSTNQVRDAIFSSGNAQLQAQYKHWLDLKQLHYFHLSTVRPDAPFSKARLDSVAQQADFLEAELVRNSAAFQEARDPITWQDVKGRLAKNAAIVSFIHFREGNDTTYAALVARKQDPEPALVRLCKKSQLEEALFAIGFPMEVTAKTYDFGKYLDSCELYRLVWQPLEPLLKGADTVFYAPTGLLHKVSFPAIGLPDSSMLLDHFNRLEYVDNAAQVGVRRPLVSKAIATACIFGSIQFEASREDLARFTPPDCSFVFSEESWDASAGRKGILPPIDPNVKSGFGQLNDQAEVDSVEYLCKYYGKLTETWRGAQASEERAAKAGQCELVHFSTHGFFSDPAKGSQSLYAAPVFTGDPLFLSGLALAGSNRVALGDLPYPCFSDGILYANEIALLDWTKVKMVVLSACETGLGEASGSEGVYGLQRGFKRAGVENLLMTLWQIHAEQGTPEFMTTFYRHWFSGMNARDAFYQTQRDMRKKYAHPYWWAGFVLI